MLPRLRRTVAPLLVLVVFATILASLANLSSCLKIASDTITRHNTPQGTPGNIAARVQLPLSHHRTSFSFIITTDPLSQVPIVSLVDANNEHDGLLNSNVGHVASVASASHHPTLPPHFQPRLIINAAPPLASRDDWDLESSARPRLHLPSFFYGILFAVLNAIWILRGFQVSILFNTKAPSLPLHLPSYLCKSFNGYDPRDGLGVLALSVMQVATLHVQAHSLLQRSRVRFLTDEPDLEAQAPRPTYGDMGIQTHNVNESLYGYQSQCDSQNEYDADDEEDEEDDTSFVPGPDDSAYTPPFIVPQSDTNAYLRQQLKELNMDLSGRQTYNTRRPINSVVEVKEVAYSPSSLGAPLHQSDRQNKIHEDEAAAPRHTRFFASFAADDDPVYSPGPADRANIPRPSASKDVRQGLPRWEVISPASAPYTDSEEGPVGQSEGSATSNESELPEDLAWLLNYRDAPVRWATQSVCEPSNSLYVSDLQASANGAVVLDIEDLEEIPDLVGSVGFEYGVQHAADIPDMLKSQIAEDVQAQDNSDVLQQADLRYSTFV